MTRATQARVVECLGGGRRLAVKRATFDLFRSGKNELSHYASTAQLCKFGKAIHGDKFTMQNGNHETRVFYAMQLYSQLDKHVS